MFVDKKDSSVILKIVRSSTDASIMVKVASLNTILYVPMELLGIVTFKLVIMKIK